MLLNLRYYLDIKFLLEKNKNIDWNEIINISKEMNISIYLFHILKKIQKNLDLEIERNILRRIKKNSSIIRLFLLNLFNKEIFSKCYPPSKYGPWQRVYKKTINTLIMPFSFKQKIKESKACFIYTLNEFLKKNHLKKLNKIQKIK